VSSSSSAARRCRATSPPAVAVAVVSIYGHLTDAAEAELVRVAHKATSNAAKAQPAQPRITSIIDLLRQWFPTRS
jgi:hypothetical protein